VLLLVPGVLNARARCDALRVSDVTTVLVLTRSGERPMQRFMNPDVQIPWMRSSRFVSLTGEGVAPHWIGSKPPNTVIYAAAFADFDRQPLLDALEALPWEDQLSVQVLIRSEDDDCWGIWMFVDGKLRELQLPGAVRVPAREYGRQWRRHLIRRPPPTELSRPWMVQLYAEGTEWRYLLHADGYLTASYGVLGEAKGAGREDARRRMTKHLVKRFGSFEAEWKKAPEGWMALSRAWAEKTEKREYR
jgi:hypothetical protein